MKANASQIRAGLDKPGDAIRLYLLHGADESGALDLAARLARSIGADAERVDLDGAALKARPSLLAEEAASMSLFGGARFIRVTGVGDESLDAVEQLLTIERAGNPVVMIAPALRATSKLVKLALGAPAALVHACYVPDGPEAARLASAIARDAGIRLDSAGAERIASAAAGDRAVMSREIEKLALYLDAAPDRPRDAGVAALAEIGADLDESRIAPTIDAITLGHPDDAANELAGYAASGGNMIALLRALSRRMIQLSELRQKVETGAGIRDVVERSNIFFKERGVFERALERWTGDRIAVAIERIHETERDLKRSGNAGDVIGAAMMAGMARAAARRR